MPTYEYACEACGQAWEKEQRITEDPIKKCPHCGKMKARRMISSGNFILKGGGWYADLYSKPPGTGGEKADPEPAKASDGDATGAGEKPAKKKAGAKKKASGGGKKKG